jgi:hypothetical protein
MRPISVRERPALPTGGAVALPIRAALIAGALVLCCAAWGAWLSAHGAHLHLAGGLILTGAWAPRFPIAALGALGLALVLARFATGWAEAVSWRVLVAGSGLLAAVWALALALIDGVGAVGAPLSTQWEYLRDVHRVEALRPFLSTFTEHVLGGSPGFQWSTHVSGHPPGALLVFVGLDRIGLGGAGWAAVVCLAVGASAVPAAVLTLRLLAGETAARAAAPFVAFAPSALWIATSADAFFLGVTAWGVCLLAYSAATHDVLAIGAGVLLGGALFLSYGLTLVGLLALAVVVGQRRIRPLFLAAAAVLAVFAAFAFEGFWWTHGLAVASQRVREGPAWIDRPTAYFVVADLAALAIAVGPATVGALALVGGDPRRRLGSGVVLPAAALAGVLLACCSNLSKGEVERIWLPFEVWLLTATAALPAASRRTWLAVQLGLALTLQLTLRLKW